MLICLVLLVTARQVVGSGLETEDANITAPKDMYVVRATVYQVGILTNSTNETEDFHNGHQETITFYRHNGSAIDMDSLPVPLETNVTAENMVGVAPVAGNSTIPWKPWTALKPPASITGDTEAPKTKREAAETPAKIIKGSAVIPPEAGVQSVALPPLITLNKNLSEIPVPIPNVSVVSYAKVNTLIHSP
ncbi:uncharacterized protein LOC121738510 [Aricia agestis]|uniref:uncharacterized protein LOC121738510 n=1 Tax=Aricia agestis TaxID=91739 RepID=UPI001C209086|nr:uncharacterized protein LOC121738510 [Aricia agestis]